MPNFIIINGKEIEATQYRNDWAIALMRQGIIVKLNVTRWSAETSLQIDDLGLKFADADGLHSMRKYFSLGKKKLLPPVVLRELEGVENRARENLKQHSFKTVWGYFVPYTAFASWEIANLQCQADFMEAARRLGERYDEIVAIVKNDCKPLARDVWLRMYADQGSPTESFIEDFISKFIAKIPARVDLIASFKYEATYLIIPMPAMLEEDLFQAKQIEQARELSTLNSTLEKETRQRIATEYRKRKQELIDGFLQATVADMRKSVADLCDSVLKSVTKNATSQDISRMQKERIKTMIKKVNMLNFHNDAEINKLLKELDSEIDKFKGERDKDVVISKLQAIVDAGTQEFFPQDFNPAIGALEI